VILFLAFILGVCFGSFGNVLIFRISKNKKLEGRSVCLHCKKQLRWYELVPVLSFAIQGAKCRHCHKKLSWQYPLVEVATGLLFVATFVMMDPQNPIQIVAACFTMVALFLLLVIGVIDAKTNTIPDILSVPLVIFGVGASYMLDRSPVLPVLLGAGVFAVQWVLSRGKAIGTGDIILGAGIGALIGNLWIVFVWILFSYILGGVIAAILLAKKKMKMNSVVAFGPMLSAMGIVMALWGERILLWMGL
jgi:prepilin signal peptidase PulO-like enzyme (type II secretory pathway)